MITTPGAHKAARSRSRSPRPSFWMRQDLKKQTPVTAESRGASTELLDASRSKPMQPRRVGGVTVETSIWGDCRLPPPRPEPRRETTWLVAPPGNSQQARRKETNECTTHNASAPQGLHEASDGGIALLPAGGAGERGMAAATLTSTQRSSTPPSALRGRAPAPAGRVTATLHTQCRSFCVAP